MDIDNGTLTDAQLSAVRHIDGPLLILAGPGSGKTRVVTHRIAYLLEQGVAANQIVALTFTNKAADEMRARVERLVPDQPVWVSTFHRFCSRLLRHYAPHVGFDSNFTIYDTSDSLRALKQVLNSAGHDSTMFTPRQIAEKISWAKNNLVTADQFEARIGKPITHVVAKVYPEYQKKLVESAAVDYDDLLLHVATLLRDNPEIRSALDERFRYILIDEYQDTNLVQYAILKALSIDHPNLAATGDPDQSIFGWRGANIKNILEFERDFPNVRVVRLEQNYRSTPSILRAADALIVHNLRRKHKQLFTNNRDGRPVSLVCYPTARDEAEGIAARIAGDVAAGRRRPRDFSIFYRTNALSRGLEEALAEFGVPYQLVKGIEFYQRKEVKDVLAYLQLVNNPRDDVALLRAVNTPPRGIGKKSLDKLIAYAERHAVPLLQAAHSATQISGLSKRAAKSMENFVAMIDDITLRASGPVEEILGLMLTKTNFREHLLASDSEEDEERLANVEELLTVAREFDERHGEESNLESFLENSALINDTDDWSGQADRVTLMTLHSAKGLEFPVVFIIAVEEKLLPHERGQDDPQQLEEERRLMFVGITRAQQELQISIAHQRDFRGRRQTAVPSTFLSELPREEMEVVDLGWPQPVERPDDEDDDVYEFAYDGSRRENFRRATPRTSVRLTTAANLANGSRVTANAESFDVEAFEIGMPVTHPEYGLGKIAALSGSGAKRKATVNFAAAGQHRFFLKESALRPARS